MSLLLDPFYPTDRPNQRRRRGLKMLLFGSCLTANSVGFCSAADFSQAQKIYVPPTRIDRRLDFAALRERQAVAGHHGSITSVSSAASPVAHRASGLVPPPPPVTPSLINSGGFIPPPPPGTMSVPPPPSNWVATAKSLGNTQVGQKVQAQAKQVVANTVAGARQKAQELIKQGKLEDADAVLRSAFKTWPKDGLISGDLTKLSIERAKQFLNNRDIEGALKAAREAVYVSPSSTAASDLLNSVLQQSGVNPHDVAERVRMGDLLSSQGRDTSATVEYRQALKIKPNAAAHVGLGNLSLRAGNKTQARQQYQQALEVDSNSALAHRQMGLLRLSSNDNVGANSDLSRALILDPNDKVASKSLIELWQRQVARTPSEVSGHMGLARAYQLSGDLKSAQSEYRQVVRLDPNNPNLPAARQSFKLAMARQEANRSHQAAKTLESQGALHEAHQKVSEALGFNPSDPNLRLYQGNLLERMGNPQAARDAYMNVLKDDPQNTAAAERVKALSAVVAPAAMAAPAALPAPTGVAVLPGEAPPSAMSPPMPTHDPVANLSNFLVSLRNHTVTEQHKIQTVQDAAHSTLKGFAKAAATQPVPAACAIAGGAAVAPTLGGAAAAAPGFGSTIAAGAGTTAASALASAAASLANGHSLSAGILEPAAAPQTFAAPPQFAAAPPVNAAPQYPSYAPMVSAPPQTFNAPPKQWTWAQEPQQAPQAFQPPPYQPVPGFGGAQQQQPPMLNQQPSFQQPPFQQPSFQQPNGPAMMFGPAPSPDPMGSLKGPIQHPSAAPNVPPLPVPSYNGAVRFELEGFKNSGGTIQLRVVLKNNMVEPLILPPNLHGVVRHMGQPDMPVKVGFSGDTIPPNGELRGTIKIPAKQLDPSADLVLPGVLPRQLGDPDLHLVTPISLR